MIEWSAANAVNPRLPEGQATVGFEACVKHVASAPSGTTCVARATMCDVDGRKLYFGVDVVEGDRVIGVGTHQRRVIDVRGA